MKPGDLVKSVRHQRIGIITEIFEDLDQKNPWIRVIFTHPHETYQWCKKEGLLLVSKKEGGHVPLLSGAIKISGSL